MAAVDPYRTNAVFINYPGIDGVEVTPSDTVDLAILPRALYIGGAGAVKVTMEGGGVVTYAGLAAGSLLPVRAARVWATGTTATLIVSIW